MKFIKILKSLTLDYFQRMIEQEREICSFGIFTDSDISGFDFAYNTKDGMDKIIANGKEYKLNNPNSNFNIDSEKWSIPEWHSFLINDENFYNENKNYSELEKIMSKLISQSNWHIEDDKNTFAFYKREIFDTMCEALKELKEEGLFKNFDEDFFLLVQESDNGIYDGREISLKKIMSIEHFKECFKYYNEEEQS